VLRVRDFLRDQTILGDRASERPPRVSVILPTFQRCASGLLERSIESVLAQTFTDFELIVMDDGSVDGSNELIERLRARDRRVIHVRHEQNCGLPGLRVNEGIELARGRFVAFQFDDDVWRPNALADLSAEIERHREPVVVVGKAHFTMHIGHVDLPEGGVDPITLHERNRFANNSVLVPRQLFVRHGMYDPHIGMRRLCDWDLWLRLVRHVSFVVLDDIVSDVFEGVSGSIGLTVPYDVALFRFLNGIARDHLLTPERWRDYPVDALRIGDVEATGELGRRLYEEQVVP
jgi:glycosyltransferase involved in cell wall biosynthesis